MALTLLIGGARSGKSVLAVEMASAHGGPVAFVATAEDRDEEMAVRIAEHRSTRPAGWITVEEPVELAAAIAAAPVEAFLVVDCLTIWVANLVERGADREGVATAAIEAAKAAAGRPEPVVVVTNDVGSGIVPMHPGTRRYRDLMGIVNTLFSRAADRAFLVVAGRALPLPATEEVIRDDVGR